MEYSRHGRRPAFETIAPDPRASFRVFHSRGSHYAFHFHRHPEMELTRIEAGRGLRYVGETVEPFEAGDLCLLGPDLPHTWSSDPRQGPVKATVIQWNPRLFSSLLEMEEWAGVRDLLERSRLGLVFHGAASRKALPSPEIFSPLRADHPERTLALLRALVDLSRADRGRTLCLKAPNPRGDRDADRLLAWVHDHADDALDQAAVAVRLGMAPSAFSHWFKRRVGKTWVAYLQELRLARACRALSETEAPILSIAVAAGFQNLSHFHRVFKESRGVTPLAYRRRFHLDP